MLNHVAEESFRQAREALRDGSQVEALALFEAAIECHRKLGVSTEIPPRYLSWYGLCLVSHAGRQHEGLHFCREATQKENYNTELHLNLGRALLAADRRREAHDVLCRGLNLDPDNKVIEKLMKAMGKRRRPAIPFLSRDNPLNIFLGRLTHQPR